MELSVGRMWMIGVSVHWRVIPAEIDFEIGHFAQLSDPDLDLGSGHTAYLVYHSSTSCHRKIFMKEHA